MSMEHLVEDFYIQLEETRNKLLCCQNHGQIDSTQAIEFHLSLDSIYRVLISMLDFVPLTTDDGDNLFYAIRKSCIEKASQFCCDLLTVVLNTAVADKINGKSSKQDTNDKICLVDDGLECQQAIANMMEISFRIFGEQQMIGPEECRNISSFTDIYSNYQRAVLRSRSKPSIANLANLRKIAKLQYMTVFDYLETTIDQENNRSDSDSDKDKWAHANTITVILGEASSLIHPLIVWKEGLMDTLAASRGVDCKSRLSSLDLSVQSGLASLCHAALNLLHNEAQNLAVKVGEWFIEDMAGIEIVSDSSLEEMAFICQILHRYNSLTCHLKHNGKEELSLMENHLAEQIFRYSTAETNFLSSNIDKAIHMAQPVQIIMGVERYVPSIVEDAYYISQRCLERASSTLSTKTVILVINSVVDVWGTIGVIYNALMSQKGCMLGKCADEKSDKDASERLVEKSPNSGLQLFLNALERDIDQSPSSRTEMTSNAKANGKSLDSHKVQLDTQFCLLNGIHAASVACEGLRSLFGSLLPEGVNGPADQTEMMVTAEEQMKQYSTAYDLLLESQIDTLLEEWIGKVHTTGTPPPLIASLPHAPSIHRLFYYFSKQNYELNAVSLREAEEQTKFLIMPFEESRLVNELQNGKCDDQVAFKLFQAISHDVSNLFLSTMFNQKVHKFTEWGSLLMAKQIRILEEYFCSHVVKYSGNTLLILREFKKLSQTLAIIQLTHPQDCKVFKQSIGNSDFDLNQDEIRCAMTLRSDWTEESVSAALH